MGMGHLGNAVSAMPFRRCRFGDAVSAIDISAIDISAMGHFGDGPFRRQDISATRHLGDAVSRDAVSAMPFRQCRFGNAVSAMPFRQCRFGNAVSAMPFRQCRFGNAVSAIDISAIDISFR